MTDTESAWMTLCKEEVELYKLILTDKGESKSELVFMFNEMTDLTSFMSEAFECAVYPIVATVGEVEE